MKQITFGLAILLAGALLITSCVQDNFNLDVLSDEMETEATLVLPFIYGSFDMDDMAEVIDAEDYSLEEEDGDRFYLVFPDTLYWLDETVDFSAELDLDVVTFFQMTVNTVNELAIIMALQVYMEDENHVVLDSLFDGRGVILEPAQIDDGGELIRATVDTNHSTIDEDNIHILADIAYLRFRVEMHSAKGEDAFVKIYASYALNYEMSLTVNGIINTGDLNITE
jgi:hypothetical protein